MFRTSINDFPNLVEYSSIHHFAGDRNLFFLDYSLKTINNHINRDLKLEIEWIRVNRHSLNVSKTNIIFFKPKNKIITNNWNFRLNGLKIQTNNYVKTILLDDLHWNSHSSQIGKELSWSVFFIKNKTLCC